MTRHLLVSPIWTERAEEIVLRTDWQNFTEEDDDLLTILMLGGWLAFGTTYDVLKIRFDTVWERGYVGVVWFCQKEYCFFRMHVSIAKWDFHAWAQDASMFRQHGALDMRIVYDLFKEWALKWSPELLDIHRFEAFDIIGARKRDQTWRVLMDPKDRVLVTLLNKVQRQFNAKFEVGPYNRVQKMHLSLDRWWGEYPEWLREGLF